MIYIARRPIGTAVDVPALGNAERLSYEKGEDPADFTTSHKEWAGQFRVTHDVDATR